MAGRQLGNARQPCETSIQRVSGGAKDGSLGVHDRTIHLRILTILLATIAAGCGAARPSVHVERAAWSPAAGIEGVELRTEHYRLRVTARDPLLRDYLPAFMETAQQAYQALIPPAQPRDEPLDVYLFNTREEWRRFTLAFDPQRAPTYLHLSAGAYMDQARATTVAFDLGRDRTLSMLAHEGLHQYLAARFPRTVAAWLNEGLATQWEAFELDGPYPRFTPRQNLFRRNNLRTALQSAEAWIPLKTLLNMNAGHAVRATGQATRSYYAQVWALVLFLRENAEPRYTPGFRRLLAEAGTDRARQAIYDRVRTDSALLEATPGEVLFRVYITDELSVFEDTYRTFARSLVH